MPGYRAGVFRRRHHYRPGRRRLPYRTQPAVVAEACRLQFPGTEREPFAVTGVEDERTPLVITGTEPEAGFVSLRESLVVYGIWCREDS
jgi:hypothetical protein